MNGVNKPRLLWLAPPLGSMELPAWQCRIVQLYGPTVSPSVKILWKTWILVKRWGIVKMWGEERGRFHSEYFPFIQCYVIYSKNSLAFIQISYPEKQRFDGGFHLCPMFCDGVFDHLVVMRHNGGCSQQVTTEGHGSNLLITHQLLICVKDNKNLKSCHRYYITTSLSSSSTRIDDKVLRLYCRPISKDFPFMMWARIYPSTDLGDGA